MRHKQHREPAAGGSQRQLRVGELVRHALADMLARGDVHDPVIEAHMITIPEVRVSADLRLATIYVMPMGGRDAEDVVAALLASGTEKSEPPHNPMSADRVRWEHIQRIYEMCNRNVSETARRLNMHRRTLQRILAKRAPR